MCAREDMPKQFCSCLSGAIVGMQVDLLIVLVMVLEEVVKQGHHSVGAKTPLPILTNDCLAHSDQWFYLPLSSNATAGAGLHCQRRRLVLKTWSSNRLAQLVCFWQGE